MNLQHCTLTGLDHQTSFSKIWKLSKLYPFAEFGVLYSKSPEGRNRYPTLNQIIDLVYHAQDFKIPLSLHVCGNAVLDLLEGRRSEITNILPMFKRIQLNFNFEKTPFDVIRLIHLFSALGTPLITQMNDGNRDFHIPETTFPHHVLYDGSLGTGVKIQSFPYDETKVLCGYAGGIGPDNVIEILNNIAPVIGKRPFWIDMESSIREDDLFSTDKAEQVLKTVQEFLERYIPS